MASAPSAPSKSDVCNQPGQYFPLQVRNFPYRSRAGQCHKLSHFSVDFSGHQFVFHHVWHLTHVRRTGRTAEMKLPATQALASCQHVRPLRSSGLLHLLGCSGSACVGHEPVAVPRMGEERGDLQGIASGERCVGPHRGFLPVWDAAPARPPTTGCQHVSTCEWKF